MKQTSLPTGDAPMIYLSTQYIRATQYLEAIVASTTDAIVTTDMRGRVIYFSPGAERMSGLEASRALGLPAHRFYEGGKEEASRVMKLLLERGTLSSYETVLAGDNRRVHISMSAALLKDRGGKLMGTLGISKDISERVALERRLRELSITDNLTGLFNQRHFHERASSELQRAQRQGTRLSLLLLDLDDFKKANDRWGHLEGDRILIRAGAAILRSIRRQVDSAFRCGGDEFIVLLPGLGLRKAETVARRIEAAVSSHDSGARVSASWGLSAFQPSDDVASLAARADAAMYASKKMKKAQAAAA